MPSRKRAKGKARKALARVTQHGGQHVRQSFTSLINFNPSKEEEDGNLICHHGCIAPSCASGGDEAFMMEFETCLTNTFARVKEMSQGKIPHLRPIACFTIIIGILEKKGLLDNNEMKKDMSKRNWIQQYLATLGTQHLLLSSVSSSSSSSSTLAARSSTVSSSSSSSSTTPHYDMAATIALCLLKLELLEAETSDFTVKMRNIAEGTERDVIRFFAKRITCGCLKKKWRAIKSEPKLGLCIHCESRKKRHELMVCSLCRKPHYCSMKCQHEHWPKRKCLHAFLCLSNAQLRDLHKNLLNTHYCSSS